MKCAPIRDGARGAGGGDRASLRDHREGTGRAIGSTRFANIDRANRHVEIGWTWLEKKWQRTAANTQAKYLMLRHAFEIWRCLRVEFKTDSLNERSRAALLRIGAKEEGIFRNHVITWTGRIRHSVYYSIVDSESPDVRAELEKKTRPGGDAFYL